MVKIHVGGTLLQIRLSVELRADSAHECINGKIMTMLIRARVVFLIILLPTRKVLTNQISPLH